jgi:hypothetical protein
VVCLFKDITSTLGHFWLVTEGSAGSSVLVTFDNCNLYIDWDDDVMGSHIIEEAKGAEVRIINGSVVEFSGHQGTWFSMGNTISCCGKLVIRNSEIIDNADDNVPFGDNYPGTILCYSKFDFEDTIITVKNWDGVGTNRCISFQKASGAINGRLKNVVLNSDNADEEEPIRFQGDEAALDGNDYLIVDNVTNNTGGFLLAVDAGNPVTALATLEANVP